MRPEERRLRAEMVRYSVALHERGWVANHDGNLSARLATNRFLATPTSVSKGDVIDSMLIVVDGQGAVVRGDRKPFSELVLHQAAYEARGDVKAVIHAHPPVATAFAVAGRALERPIIAEAVVSLGASVPLAPFALPGSEGFTAPVAELLVRHDVILLANHGVLSVGVDLEQAYLRIELVEHLARIEWHAQALGGARYLDAADLPPLLDKRSRAGLGPRARGLEESDGGAAGPPDQSTLRRIVAEEIRAAFAQGEDR